MKENAMEKKTNQTDSLLSSKLRTNICHRVLKFLFICITISVKSNVFANGKSSQWVPRLNTNYYVQSKNWFFYIKYRNTASRPIKPVLYCTVQDQVNIVYSQLLSFTETLSWEDRHSETHQENRWICAN